MTQPHPQPKEYTTTLENICEGCGMCRRKEDDLRECCILERVRSRPHTPEPAAVEPICDNSCKRKHCSRKFYCCEYDGDFDE